MFVVEYVYVGWWCIVVVVFVKVQCGMWEWNFDIGFVEVDFYQMVVGMVYGLLYIWCGFDDYVDIY